MNRYLITGIVATFLWDANLSKAWTQPPSCIPKSQSEVTTSVNSLQQSEVILIGKVPNRRYVVVVPGKSDKVLNVVRSYIADAFLTQHQLGPYVYAGGFVNREEAECASLLLRSQGLDARVVYFH
ncbi:peptidoglycan-binding domain 1 [Cylindrospermum sp. NIES-4074]|nr:peptidoglycan-binding domain 1 [Cylindrospermum sp. NIES-4074]